MLAYQIHDMTCGHCASTITKAVKAVDPGAEISIDLGRQRVTVAPAAVDARRIQDAITEAGYSPVAVEALEPAAASAPATCCCGACR